LTIYGYDAAYPPDPAAVARAGGKIMAVYLTARYAVDALHCARIHAAGMGVLLNYEEGVDELVYCGRAKARDVGQRAMAAAIRDGAPADGTLGIAFSVDVSVPPSQFSAVGASFDGLNDALRGKFRVHVYGEGALIDYLLATGRAVGAQWLSASRSFPGYNAGSVNVGFVQLVGSNIAGTDQNIITNAAGLDVWWPANSTIGVRRVFDANEVAQIKSAAREAMAEIATDPNHVYWPQLGRNVAQVAGDVWSQPVANGVQALTAAQWLARPGATVDVKALAGQIAASIPQTDLGVIEAAVKNAMSALKFTIVQGA
jgi:hypothetical protein